MWTQEYLEEKATDYMVKARDKSTRMELFPYVGVKPSLQVANTLLTIHKKKNMTKNIDWEQRRYEIAKDVYCALIREEYPSSLEFLAKMAVLLADKLIEEHKKINEL